MTRKALKNIASYSYYNLICCVIPPYNSNNYSGFVVDMFLTSLATFLSTTTGAISISGMIKINHTLQVLNISRNPIGDKGISAIAKNLDNAMISKLNLYKCNITVNGAKSLAEGLMNNQTIKPLDVMSNDITVKGTILILKRAVANRVCEEVITDYRCSVIITMGIPR